KLGSSALSLRPIDNIGIPSGVVKQKITHAKKTLNVQLCYYQSIAVSVHPPKGFVVMSVGLPASLHSLECGLLEMEIFVGRIRALIPELPCIEKNKTEENSPRSCRFTGFSCLD
ncbi:MAG: hypothetical protein V1784_12045, partial [bacterium]